MQNFKITIQYDGTAYNGWQKQGNTKNTISEKFENVLFFMCGKEVEIHASGRTDAGVHAECQVANFKCNTDLDCDEIKDYLNKYLPSDILVTSVEKVHERFHSRLNAKSKTYKYTISPEKPDVFMRKYVWYSGKLPDVEKMRRAANLLVGSHDFVGFSSVKKPKKSTVRYINTIDICEEDGLIHIVINGNGFLYNMVRIISGTLFEIGTGMLEETVIDKVFRSGKRENAGATLPPCGLKLAEVFY